MQILYNFYWYQIELKLCTLVHLALASKNFLLRIALPVRPLVSGKRIKKIFNPTVQTFSLPNQTMDFQSIVVYFSSVRVIPLLGGIVSRTFFNEIFLVLDTILLKIILKYKSSRNHLPSQMVSFFLF